MDGNTTLNELYHHGVKGMKWGVRKDKKTKNKNGSSTKTTNNDKRKKALKISSVAGIGLGIGGVIGGAATGNPVLAFASMGLISASGTLASVGDAPINSSNIQKKAEIGHDFLQEHMNTHNNNLALFNQHTQIAIDNHQNMVNDHNMSVQLHNQNHMNMMTTPHMNMF